jgi:hypothetical protein
MDEDDRWSPALDLFWEEADLADAAEHPLRRELAHRLDVLARYEQLLADAESHGNPGQIDALAKQRRRQLEVIGRLQDALQRHDERNRTEDAEGPARHRRTP